LQQAKAISPAARFPPQMRRPSHVQVDQSAKAGTDKLFETCCAVLATFNLLPAPKRMHEFLVVLDKK
jgi:hypothetical protein